VLRQTYDDLLAAATHPMRADLLLLGELNYAGPIVAEVTGIPWASYVLAPLSFFSAFDPPVLPPYPRLARADKVTGFGRVIKRLARFTTRNWPEPIYELRRELGLPPGSNPIFDAKHSPYLVLALFSRVLGVKQKDWPAHTLIFTIPMQATPRCRRISRNSSLRASRRSSSRSAPRLFLPQAISTKFPRERQSN